MGNFEKAKTAANQAPAHARIVLATMAMESNKQLHETGNGSCQSASHLFNNRTI
ncbi:hypothetical protein KD050_13215 [Psychrobacillus sp. INOP01]|uniref:hypothetical protein n=1 Tax=Psychrobacillus sp. INOP01 TaxID=2829187 RepID=UPI001BA49D9F|nr:hypothetical protein [Psychrobacillus sp. INOP01]QUG40258.1 hypothetical protein KD050_13215 [Psychrobacillus sp. INOP01]